MKKYTITSALPYANGPIHLGHLAGAYLPADIYVRYLRLMGKDVVFICGSDEHGAAITIRAKKEGLSPKDIIDKYHFLNKDTFERLGISFDIYHRTSEPLHYETAQQIFTKLYEDGEYFEEKTSEQYYDESYNQFLADRYIEGTCPKCSFEGAFGDQCENCGSTLSPDELINPKSKLSGNEPIKKTTKHWYFKLDKAETWLKEWIEKGTLNGQPHHNPDEWKKHVLGQCMSWIDGGLKPRAITRDLDWGIPVPLDEAEGKVLYVWFDAPIGYISATRQWAIDNDKNWEDYWKGDDVELIHFIGKDNIVFHCIVFPALLKAHGDYALPKNVPANQFLNFEGQKFSKSRGWGIEQHEYLNTFENFPNKEDALRYALTRNMPENRDSDFKWDEFVEYHDKELADKLGNFINRVMVLTHKYFDGKVPAVSDATSEPEGFRVLDQVKALLQQWQKDIESYSFKAAAQTFMEIASFGNTYLQDVSPWKIFKTEPDSPIIKDCMYNSLQIAGLLSLLAAPIIPFTANKLRELFNLPELQNGDLEKALNQFEQDSLIIPTGHQIGTAEILFAKIHDRKDNSRLDIINAQKEKLAAILENEKPKQAPIKETIQYDDFMKLDIRTGTILEAMPVKKADKLLELKVDIGLETRTVVSGIAQHFKPDEVIGKQVLLLANLAPRKLRGVTSQGMILMTEDADGRLTFVQPDQQWDNGMQIS